MKLYEYEGKKLFNLEGVAIPKGRAVTTQEEALEAARELGGTVVVKSQILQGGRGKAGGIKFADTPEEAARIASELLNRSLLDEKIKTVLVEEKLVIKNEFYAGITFDPAEALPLLMFSTEGGVEIETIAGKSPDKIVKMYLQPLKKPEIHDVMNMVAKTGMGGPAMVGISKVLLALTKVYFRFEAITSEINPLIIDGQGRVMAADAKLDVDDSAISRVPELKEINRQDPQLDACERLAQKADVSYCSLEGGCVGIIAGGAGLGMATMDMLNLHSQNGDGKPANFLDLGGNATSEKTAAALRIVLKSPGVKGVLINVFGGINNCEQMALGISQVMDELKPSLPLVVKIRGHSQDEGWAILETQNIPMVKFGTTEEAVILLRKEMGLEGA